MKEKGLSFLLRYLVSNFTPLIGSYIRLNEVNSSSFETGFLPLIKKRVLVCYSVTV